MTCTDNVLASISNIYAGESKMKPGDIGDVACDWTGPGQIDGLYDCDDFNFECYDGVLYGIKTIESDTACPSIDYSPFGSSLDGVVCNFATSMRTTGENYVAFSFDCQNGTTSYIYYDQSVAKKVDRIADSAPSCTTWATAAGVSGYLFVKIPLDSCRAIHLYPLSFFPVLIHGGNRAGSYSMSTMKILLMNLPTALRALIVTLPPLNGQKVYRKVSLLDACSFVTLSLRMSVTLFQRPWQAP